MILGTWVLYFSSLRHIKEHNSGLFLFISFDEHFL